MARNRKYRSAALRFGPALKAFLLCLLLGGSGVGYVWQKSQINELGKQILLRERRLEDLTEQNVKLGRQLATSRNPRMIELTIKRLNLGLVQADQSQKWKLPEPLAEAVRLPAPAEYAAQTSVVAEVP